MNLLNEISRFVTAFFICIFVGSGCSRSQTESLDESEFLHPDKHYFPEIWLECMRGNLSEEGVLADMKALDEAGFSGLQMFFGGRGDVWPGMEEQIYCLTPEWEQIVHRAAVVADSLGLFFTVQNCPGWAMSGGPWIDLDHCMRKLVSTRCGVEGDVDKVLPKFDGDADDDYRDVMVLAFPTPEGETGQPLKVARMSVPIGNPLTLPPVQEGSIHTIDVTLEKAAPVRSVRFSPVQEFNHSNCYSPGVHFKVEALYSDSAKIIADFDAPQASWQDDKPLTVSCDEPAATSRYRISISNRHELNLYSLELFSDAFKNNYESEAAMTLRSILRETEHPVQNAACYIKPESILDITDRMDSTGRLKWSAPEGKWTVLRIGHANTKAQNGPAPKEATGWECDKFSVEAEKIHIANYVGRIADGPAKGLLKGMLLDSWEAKTQTWSATMEEDFESVTGYSLRQWIPALLGYVIGDQETTSKFLCDWRYVINDLLVNRFYGTMAQLAHDRGLRVSYETAAGDIFPADIMEYFKYADIPMCEFWHCDPDETFLGALNFKPIKPTASAARLYGKKRVDAESYTSFQLTWNETMQALRENSNKNVSEGVTHFVYHTCTHNPRPNDLIPGSSFGGGIGTPFVRNQTWWRYMRSFNEYHARISYMMEHGNPVSDVLWYLGDETDHKPDQHAQFPAGYKYDYCNYDILHHRLSVDDGRLVTPEGLSYRLLWIPSDERLRPETLEKLVELAKAGAMIVAEPPYDIATLSGGEEASRRFNDAFTLLWGGDGDGVLGKGRVIAGRSLEEVFEMLGMKPDLIAEHPYWCHRSNGTEDWYFVAAPYYDGLNEDIRFRNTGAAEIWNPVTGETTAVNAVADGEYGTVHIEIPRGGSCFVVFRQGERSSKVEAPEIVSQTALGGEWSVSFPAGWSAPENISVDSLVSWTEFDMSREARAFSGTATYLRSLDIQDFSPERRYVLDLGKVCHYATVYVNDMKVCDLWTPPYVADITDAVRQGGNALKIEVTNNWRNRLIFDAGEKESERKTWTDDWPSPDEPFCESGLIGPVNIYTL